MATPKTPVSILNEYMFRAKQVPQFELVHCVSLPDPFFEYQVTVDNIKVKGSGRNKKVAKHNAALKALEELAKSDHIVRKQLLMCSGTSRAVDDDKDSNIASVAVSPPAELVTENAVGALATLCAQNELPVPEYKVVEESGPPHCKTFRMHCTVLSLVGVGVSATKKQAKHISAKNMIDKLNEHLGTSAVDIGVLDWKNRVPPSSKDHNVAIKTYCMIKERERGCTIRENLNLNLATCHLNLQGLTGAEVKLLKDKQISYDKPEDVLKRFAEEQRVSISFEFTKALKDENSFEEQHLCVASLGTVPELVQFGIGKDEDLAREYAAFKLLGCLMTMLEE